MLALSEPFYDALFRSSLLRAMDHLQLFLVIIFPGNEMQQV